MLLRRIKPTSTRFRRLAHGVIRNETLFRRYYINSIEHVLPMLCSGLSTPNNLLPLCCVQKIC